jgi:hypothetical protein
MPAWRSTATSTGSWRSKPETAPGNGRQGPDAGTAHQLADVTAGELIHPP